MTIPSGHVQLPSGVIVRQDTFAASVYQDTPLKVHNSGRRQSERRGIDDWSPTDKKRAETIETARRADPIISRGIQYYVMLSIGTGLRLDSRKEDGADSSGGDAVLDFCRTFWDANEMDDQQEVIATELTGHANLYAHMPKPTRVDPREFVPGMQLIPSGQIFRIATKDGKPWYYRRQWRDRDYAEPEKGVREGVKAKDSREKIFEQDIMAEEMVHFAMNRGAQDLRGVSMFEAAIYWSTLYHRVLDTVWAYAVARSMFATHITVDDANPDQVEKTKNYIQDNILVDREDPTGQTYKTIGVGQVLTTGGGITIEQLTQSMAAGTIDAEIRRVLLMAAVALGLPEFALSDGNYSNLASSQSQNAPFFRTLLSHQHHITRAIRRILRKALDWYVVAGKSGIKSIKPPDDGSHIVDWIEIIAPNVLEPEVSAIGSIVLQLVTGGIWSKEYANQFLGTDWDKMMDQIKAEKDAGFGPQQPMFAGIGFPSGNGNGGGNGSRFGLVSLEGRDETQGIKNRIKSKGAAAIEEFGKKLLMLNGDKQGAIAAFVEVNRKLKDDLQSAIEKGEKIGAESVAA